MKKLEQACKEQEKALEKMDKALKGKLGKQGVRFKEGMGNFCHFFQDFLPGVSVCSHLRLGGNLSYPFKGSIT